MTLEELKSKLAAILAEEESPEVDWSTVEYLSERTYVLLTEPDTPQGFPQESVIGYLAAYDRRRQDPAFADYQRHWLRSYLHG